MRYLMIILAFGMLGSLFGQVTSRSSRPSEERKYFEHAGDADSDREENESDASDKVARMDGALELQRDSDGHFYADVQINGAQVHMLVDTGASAIALSRDDALTARIPTSIGMNEVVGRGADGDVHGEFVRLERVELGPLTATDLEAIVLNSGEQSLLGQSFLSKFASVQIEGDTMVLR